MWRSWPLISQALPSGRQCGQRRLLLVWPGTPSPLHVSRLAGQLMGCRRPGTRLLARSGTRLGRHMAMQQTLPMQRHSVWMQQDGQCRGRPTVLLHTAMVPGTRWLTHSGMGAAGAQDSAADASGALGETAKGAVGLLQQQASSIGSKFLFALQWPYRTAARQVSYAEDAAKDQLTAGDQAIRQQAGAATGKAQRAAGSVKDQAWEAEQAIVGGSKQAIRDARRRANNAAGYSEVTAPSS